MFKWYSTPVTDRNSFVTAPKDSSNHSLNITSPSSLWPFCSFSDHGLPNLLPPQPRLQLRFANKSKFYGVGLSAQPPTWRTGVSLFVRVIIFDLSGMGAPARSYATAGIALRILWPRKPRQYVKVRIPSAGLKYYYLSYLSGISLFIAYFISMP
jgi:hypothetical protein